MTSESKNSEERPEMEYRLLGRTGLKISTFSYGFFASIGSEDKLDIAKAIMRRCREAGVNFFDNAEAYGATYGDAETAMGKALKQLQEEDPKAWERTELVISTKLFWGGKGVNDVGLCRKHIMEAMSKSLKRLQLDYVDLVFCHRPDHLTGTEHVVRAMSDLVSQGKALYWGTSMWTAVEIMEAMWIAKTNGLHPPVIEQPEYNMFNRENMEKNYLKLFEAPYSLGTTIWGPLNHGILTGKYNDGVKSGTRIDRHKWAQRYITDEKIEKVKKLSKYAEEQFQTTSTVLAIAWCAKNRNVTTVLLGASKEAQIVENLKALEVAKNLTQKNMDEIEEILGNKPEISLAPNRTTKVLIE